MSKSCVVTGGARGISRAVVERLAGDEDGVVIVDRDGTALDWLATHPAPKRMTAVVGDASDEVVAERAVSRAEAVAPLVGWVNNAATFRDASARTARGSELADAIAANLNLAVVGSVVAIRATCWPHAPTRM